MGFSRCALCMCIGILVSDIQSKSQRTDGVQYTVLLAGSRPPRTGPQLGFALAQYLSHSIARYPASELKLSRSGAFLGRAAHKYTRCDAHNTECRTSDARVRDSRASQDRNMKPAACIMLDSTGRLPEVPETQYEHGIYY